MCFKNAWGSRCGSFIANNCDSKDFLGNFHNTLKSSLKKNKEFLEEENKILECFRTQR